jgi:protoporphyrin/coproporphyrin ferrochelatase
MVKPKTAILLMNVGTPKNHSIPAVRKYLFEFLNDARVIDLPWLLRKILVNLIIVPFRAPKSAKLYKRLWTEKGSPLIVHGLSLQHKLQQELGDDYLVALAMNYQQPNIKEVLKEVLKQNVERIILFPLFPQYASSTTGSVFEKVFKLLARENNIPGLVSIAQYYSNSHYIAALAAQVATYGWNNYDYVLFSFHGLPLRQVYCSHQGKTCDQLNCATEVNVHNQYCYHATCYATSRMLAAKLEIPEDKYLVCFQSRMVGKWLSPFTDQVIKALPGAEKKRVLVVCPSFTADCLETIIEIGHYNRELFMAAGGELFTLVESLNDSSLWVEAAAQIIKQHADYQLT